MINICIRRRAYHAHNGEKNKLSETRKRERERRIISWQFNMLNLSAVLPNAQYTHKTHTYSHSHATHGRASIAQLLSTKTTIQINIISNWVDKYNSQFRFENGSRIAFCSQQRTVSRTSRNKNTQLIPILCRRIEYLLKTPSHYGHHTFDKFVCSIFSSLRRIQNRTLVAFEPIVRIQILSVWFLLLFFLSSVLMQTGPCDR